MIKNILFFEHIDQWNRLDSPEINPCTYGQSVIKEARIPNGEKDSLFHKWRWENWTVTCKRMNSEHSLTSYAKINSKWIKDLTVILETIKLLEENIGRILFDIKYSNIFFDLSPKAKEIKIKTNKWDLIKFKSFCTATNKMKRQMYYWGETICKWVKTIRD